MGHAGAARRVAMWVPVVALALAAPSSASAEEGETRAEGLKLRPAVSWSSGEHRLDLNLQHRYRYESWQARSRTTDGIHGIRTRLGIGYGWKDQVRLFAQGQLTHVLNLSANSSGAGALYRANTPGGDNSTADSIRVRQAFLEVKPAPRTWVRAGRQDINGGTLIQYAEPNWKFLKLKRLSQRLVGTVEWTHGARSYDGAAARLQIDGHLIHAFAAEPTTGVFDIDNAYKRQKDVVFGGVDWTVERGTWAENSEIGAFFIAYADDRDPARVTGLLGDIEVYTLGARWLGVYPTGPGNLDVILWGAFQFGDYHDSDSTPSNVRKLDQLAGAVIAEFGYQLTEVWGKPWLRAGVNWASGDSSPDDGDRNTFFNILPTNHLYYGYTDQLAFQNLVDLLVELKLAPLPKLRLELTFHQFWLPTDDDARYFGTGAFNRSSLGFGSSPSNGSNNVGQEIDFVASYKLNRHVSIAGGYAKLFGGGVFDGARRKNTNWGFAEVSFAY